LDLLKGTEIVQYQTDILSQESGFEKRSLVQEIPTTINNLQPRNILYQNDIEYLIALWLCVKGEGAGFYFDNGFETNRVRFVSKALSYTCQSNALVYSLASLQVKQLPVFIYFVNVTFYGESAQGGEMWPNYSCGGGWVFKILTPFTFTREDYPTNNDVGTSVITTATYEIDGTFATLMWNGQKKRLIPTGGTSSGTLAPNQSVINKAIAQGGVYHTTICENTPGWQSGSQPIYMLMTAGQSMNVNNPVTIEFVGN
jgi:hypothetical protein